MHVHLRSRQFLLPLGGAALLRESFAAVGPRRCILLRQVDIEPFQLLIGQFHKPGVIAEPSQFALVAIF